MTRHPRRRNELVRVCRDCSWRAPAGFPGVLHAESEHKGVVSLDLVAWCGRCDEPMRLVRRVGTPPGAVDHTWRCDLCRRNWRVRELAQTIVGASNDAN